MKLKYTPGPWGLWKNNGKPEDQPAFPSVVIEGTHQLIADLFGDSITVTANAQLISTAPRMLEALIDNYKALNAITSFGAIKPFIERTKQVIEKATGLSIEEILEDK